MKTVVLCLRFAVYALVTGIVLCGCGSKKAGISLVSWNVQNFFDAETAGTEYHEFRSSASRWNRERYEIRLDRLAESIDLLDGDIIVLQEIENRAVMQDIYNRLSRRLYGQRRYRYASFGKEADAVIGIGIFSRIPLTAMRLHTAVNYTGAMRPPLRPLMEIEISADSGVFTLFACHWKSLSGGTAVSEFWQREQEAVLARRLSCSSAAVVCGDFNRDASLFLVPENLREGRGNSVFKANSYSVQVYNPWCDGICTVPGSYWFQNEWKRFDSVFSAGDIIPIEFTPCVQGPWIRMTENGVVPFCYSVYSGSGYSDHLPVRCRLILN